MPFNVTMEQEHAWIICTKADYNIGVPHNGNSITHRGVLIESNGIIAWESTGTRCRACKDLEMVTMEVKWVGCGIVVVQNNVNNVAVAGYERVNIAVDYRVGIGISDAGSGV